MDTQLEVLSRQTDVYNESGTQLLYTIRPCPRSLIVAKHPTSYRPYYTPWSKVLCQLCPQPFEIEMKELQHHIAKQHLFDIRGEFMEAPDGSLRVTCKKYDASNEDYLYNIVKYKSYCTHTGRRLYVKNTELTQPTDKNCVCLSCQGVYPKSYIIQHIRNHGFDIIGLWKEVIDECGNHVLDSRLVFDPVRTPFVQKLCAVRDENVTNEDFITVYDENGQRVYSIEPKIKPTLRNWKNELLYTQNTMCKCYLCKPVGNQIKQYEITHIQYHLLNDHQICLRNNYKREPGKIIFESTKRPTDLDHILDANRSIIYWDQKGIPVWWRIRSQLPKSESHFCLRCELKPTTRTKLLHHLKLFHKIEMNNKDKYCYNNVIGDFIYYFDNHNTIQVGTSSSSARQGALKRPATDSNANLVDASLYRYINFPQRTATHTLPLTAAGLTASATTGSSQTSIGTASQPKFILTSGDLAQSGVASATQGSSQAYVSSSSNVSPQPVQRLPRRSETTTTSSLPYLPTSSAMTSGQAALHPAPQGSVESQTPIEAGPLKCIFCQQLMAYCVCFEEKNC